MIRNINPLAFQKLQHVHKWNCRDVWSIFDEIYDLIVLGEKENSIPYVWRKFHHACKVSHSPFGLGRALYRYCLMSKRYCCFLKIWTTNTERSIQWLKSEKISYIYLYLWWWPSNQNFLAMKNRIVNIIHYKLKQVRIKANFLLYLICKEIWYSQQYNCKNYTIAKFHKDLHLTGL